MVLLFWYFVPSSKASQMEVTKKEMKRIILSLTLFIAIMTSMIACGQPSNVVYQQPQTPVVYYDLNGRPYYVNEYNQAYYLDDNGGYTTVIVPSTSVWNNNGIPVFINPNRAIGSRETLQYRQVTPQPRISTVPAARQPSTTYGVPQQRVNTVPQSRINSTQSVPQSRVSTVPAARTTAPPAPVSRPAPRVSTVPASRH